VVAQHLVYGAVIFKSYYGALRRQFATLSPVEGAAPDQALVIIVKVIQPPSKYRRTAACETDKRLATTART